MTVSTSIYKAGPYAGSGTTGPFTVTFRFLANSHLRVIKTSTTGSETTLNLGVDYSVTGAGGASGTVTLTSPLLTGDKLTIVRNVPLTQETDYVFDDSFPSESHEAALDKLTMLAQQLQEEVGRTLRISPSVTGTSTELPVPVANQIIGWNSAATALRNIDASTLATLVAFSNAQANVFTGNGSQTVFTLSENPASINNLDVSVNGVTLVPGDDYTWNSGLNVTFTVAPPNGASILIRYMLGVPVGEIGNSSVTTEKMADLNVTTEKMADLNVTTEKVANDAVTFPKMQNIATARLLGRASAGTGDVEELASIPSGVDVPAARLSGTIATARLPGEALITLGTSVNSTSGTAIDFTGIPAWAKRITVMFNGVSLNGSSTYLVQLGTISGVTTTGYAAAGGLNAGGTTAVVTATNGFPIRNSQNAANITSGSMVITLVSGNVWVSSHSLGDATNSVVMNGGGNVTLSGTLDRVRITTVNGTDTFDAGSINIMYEG